MITFQCPSCGKEYSVPDEHGGKKTTCRSCQAKIAIPADTAMTVKPLPSGELAHPASEPSAHRPSMTRCPFCDTEISASAKKCKHCGETVDVALRAAEEAKEYSRRSASSGGNQVTIQQVSSGNDSGAVRSGYRCPFCKTNTPPVFRSQISTAGWIVFAVLLVFTCIFCWIGLLMKEEYRVCPECNARV